MKRFAFPGPLSFLAALSLFAAFAPTAWAQTPPAATPPVQTPTPPFPPPPPVSMGAPLPNFAPTPEFFFRDGDRALILGDSITQQLQYSNLIESYTLSRFPTWSITFRNVGVSSDRADMRMRGGQEAGLKRDIFPLNPTAVTVDFGMNDGRVGSAGLQTYMDTERSLSQALTAVGARVALVTSSSEERYDAGQPAGSAYNLLLHQYSEGLKSVAMEKNLFFVNQLDPMTALIDAGRASGVLSPVPGGTRLVPDGIHPNWPGHLVMATQILKGLNAPALVSSVQIDAAGGEPDKPVVLSAQNAGVSSIMRDKPQVTTEGLVKPVGPFTKDSPYYFARTDGALPWPIPADAAPALKLPGFTPYDDLSRFMLIMANLPGDSYQLACDDVPVGTYTRDQLAAGVNLSNVPGPIFDQSQNLLKKITEKNTLFFNRWRQVQLYTNPAWITSDIEAERAKELDRLDGLIAAKEAEINAVRMPVMHIWSLKLTDPNALPPVNTPPATNTPAPNDAPLVPAPVPFPAPQPLPGN